MFSKRSHTITSHRTLPETIERLTTELASADPVELRDTARRVAFRLRRVAYQLERGCDAETLKALNHLSERIDQAVQILTPAAKEEDSDR